MNVGHARFQDLLPLRLGFILTSRRRLGSMFVTKPGALRRGMSRATD
jgi:hypothetical protein